METHATGGRPLRTRVVDGRLLLELKNDTAQVEAGQQALREFLEAEGTSARALYHAELAFEELVVNVIRHGYRDRSGSSLQIDVSAWVRGEEIVFTVEDTGPPFDPSQAVDAPLATRIEDAKIGGLGLRLVRMAAKHIDYERAGDRNRVTIVIPRI
jgi:serine/threonine-protein kinase RsbW